MKINDLNLSTTTKPKTRNPITHRRLTLLNSINKQLTNIDNTIEGNPNHIDVDTGRRINNWYWLDESGNYFLTINYGRVPLELDKNKFSIMCKDLEDIKSNLEKVKDLVKGGKLDNKLSQKSSLIRKNFSK